MTPPPIETGLTLSGHLLTEEIGEGGYARVFRSERADGTSVAIKVAHSPEAAAALRAEAAALRVLQGPRFVRVLEEHLDADPPFLVLEHYVGGDLRRALERQKRLAPDFVLDLFESLCEGMDEVHRRGLVHGDLKPENILIDADGEPRIADLGLVREVPPTPGIAASIATEEARVRGTYDYLAPEVRRGERATPASDVYALGILLYEMLVGTRPLGTFEPASRLLSRGHVDIAPYVARQVDAVIEHALAPQAGSRPTAADLLHKLRSPAARVAFRAIPIFPQENYPPEAFALCAGFVVMMSAGLLLTIPHDEPVSAAFVVVGLVVTLLVGMGLEVRRRVPEPCDIGRPRRPR